MKFETKCLHEGYVPKNGEPRVVPIVQSTTYAFDSSNHIAELFDMPTEYIYSRFANPTCDAVEKKLAALEGGVAAMLTSSGQAASLISVLNLCSSGDSFVAVSTIYGGTVNLFSVTLKRLGIDVIWVDPNATSQEIAKAIKPNTKLIFGETIANPALTVCDIQKFANVAHENGIPLFIDNTFATPALCRPIEFGADVVIHSTSKYLDGHALQVGGAIIDSGNFDWSKSDKFPAFVTPDESYHGIVYTKTFGKAAFIVKARMQLQRDFGAYPSAHSAFLLNLGIETLFLRMERYSYNGLEVAKYFQNQPQVEKVFYPGLESDSYNQLAQKYLPNGCSGVVTFIMRGGRLAAMKFMDSLKLATKCVHVADIRTCALHPASSTHRQLTDEQLVAAKVEPGLIRFSCGLENVQDIIDDIQQAFNAL